jgi:hypothetical protein
MVRALLAAAQQEGKVKVDAGGHTMPGPAGAHAGAAALAGRPATPSGSDVVAGFAAAVQVASQAGSAARARAMDMGVGFELVTSHWPSNGVRRRRTRARAGRGGQLRADSGDGPGPGPEIASTRCELSLTLPVLNWGFTSKFTDAILTDTCLTSIFATLDQKQITLMRLFSDFIMKNQSI